MPIRKVPGGWQWGTRGKVYATRNGAARQARAAYANGYVGKLDDADRAQAVMELQDPARAKARTNLAATSTPSPSTPVVKPRSRDQIFGETGYRRGTVRTASLGDEYKRGQPLGSKQRSRMKDDALLTDSQRKIVTDRGLHPGARVSRRPAKPHEKQVEERVRQYKGKDHDASAAQTGRRKASEWTRAQRAVTTKPDGTRVLQKRAHPKTGIKAKVKRGAPVTMDSVEKREMVGDVSEVGKRFGWVSGGTNIRDNSHLPENIRTMARPQPWSRNPISPLDILAASRNMMSGAGVGSRRKVKVPRAEATYRRNMARQMLYSPLGRGAVQGF